MLTSPEYLQVALARHPGSPPGPSLFLPALQKATWHRGARTAVLDSAVNLLLRGFSWRQGGNRNSVFPFSHVRLVGFFFFFFPLLSLLLLSSIFLKNNLSWLKRQQRTLETDFPLFIQGTGLVLAMTKPVPHGRDPPMRPARLWR